MFCIDPGLRSFLAFPTQGGEKEPFLGTNAVAVQSTKFQFSKFDHNESIAENRK